MGRAVGSLDGPEPGGSAGGTQGAVSGTGKRGGVPCLAGAIVGGMGGAALRAVSVRLLVPEIALQILMEPNAGERAASLPSASIPPALDTTLACLLSFRAR